MATSQACPDIDKGTVKQKKENMETFFFWGIQVSLSLKLQVWQAYRPIGRSWNSFWFIQKIPEEGHTYFQNLDLKFAPPFRQHTKYRCHTTVLFVIQEAQVWIQYFSYQLKYNWTVAFSNIIMWISECEQNLVVWIYFFTNFWSYVFVWTRPILFHQWVPQQYCIWQ